LVGGGGGPAANGCDGGDGGVVFLSLFSFSNVRAGGGFGIGGRAYGAPVVREGRVGGA